MSVHQMSQERKKAARVSPGVTRASHRSPGHTCQHKPGRSRRLPRPRTPVQRPSDAATRSREAGAWSGRARPRLLALLRGSGPGKDGHRPHSKCSKCARQQHRPLAGSVSAAQLLECNRGVTYFPVPSQSAAGVPWGVRCNGRLGSVTHNTLGGRGWSVKLSTRCIRARGGYAWPNRSLDAVRMY
jgi:hypothetical protein